MTNDKFISVEAIAKRYPAAGGGQTTIFENLWLSLPRGEFGCLLRDGLRLFAPAARNARRMTIAFRIGLDHRRSSAGRCPSAARPLRGDPDRHRHRARRRSPPHRPRP